MSDHAFNFDELVESVREAIDINKGIKKPSRSFKYEEIIVFFRAEKLLKENLKKNSGTRFSF